MITIEKINEVFVQVDCEESVRKEIEEYLSWTVPHYVPSKAQFIWLKRRDMKMPLFNIRSGTLPIGLLPDLISFLRENKYEYKIEGIFGTTNFSSFEAEEFIKTLNLPSHIEVRDYQLKYFVKCVRNRRGICIAPVNSGKTLIMYLLFRYFNEKTLITVPNITLVGQLADDFKFYGYKENIHEVTGGVEKVTEDLLTVSTWQSLQNQKQYFYDEFRVVLGDEAHTNAGDVLVKMMNMMINIGVRVGLTGTMPDEMLYQKQIIGCFGPVMTYITTDEMIKRGFSTNLVIKMVKLNHRKDELIGMSYEEERDYLIANKKRNQFLANLALSQKGNTFVMFRNIPQGKAIYELIKVKSKVPVYYVDGKTPIKPINKRKEILDQIKLSKNSISVVSVVFVTGVNIPNIDNIIFAHPSKSRIRVLQAIGRGLRVGEGKNLLTVLDVFDKTVSNPDVHNTTLNHAQARKNIYKKEKFNIKEYEVDL